MTPYNPGRYYLFTSALNSSADYVGALTNLLPRGRVWPTDPASVQQQVLAALAPTAEALDGAAQDLLVDSFPATAIGLLGEWESSLGLTPSSGETVSQRQANVVARLTEVGGQSSAYFIAYAATLGFVIAIETYAPFRCGANGCGDAIGDDQWAFAWSITVVSNTGALTNAQLLDAIEAIAPAETAVFLTT